MLGKYSRQNPRGLIPEMDNDAGTMSGWYVFATLGLYPIIPGEPIYSLHTPQIRSAKIALDKDRYFIIETDKDPVTYPYIKKILLNGQRYSKSWINHADIAKGGTIKFELSKKPNKSSHTAVFLSHLK